MDSQLSTQDALTFQGDIYQTHVNQLAYYSASYLTFSDLPKTIKINDYGGNLLSRLQHTFSPTSDYTLQFYYDTYTRNRGPVYESRDTLDLDFQHRFALLDGMKSSGDWVTVLVMTTLSVNQIQNGSIPY